MVNGDPEYHDWGPGANWETALAEDLRDRVDDRYRTVVHRNGRAIVGLSAGGYGASIIGVHRPETYAAIQSWSGYFHPTDPSGTRTRSVGTTADNDDADVESLVPRLRSQFRTHPTSFAFYVGSADPTFVPANRSLQRALTAARVEHLFRVYPGGDSQTLWQAHAAAWLRLALDALERA